MIFCLDINQCISFYRLLLLSRLLSKKSKNETVEDYNFACGFVWVRTWSLTLREKHRLRLFENKMLRRIFGSKRDEVKGGGAS
jgi:hypothetical protein